MDIATITSAYTGLKTAKDLFQSLQKIKIDTITVGQLNDAAKAVGEAQDTMFSLREELFRLQDENNSIKEQLSTKEEWIAKISQYELCTTHGGANSL